MKIDRVTYQKIFPTGMAYLNHKIGVEVQVDDNDNPDTVYEYAKQKVEQWNIESNPGMAVAMEYMNQPYITPQKIEQKVPDEKTDNEFNELKKKLSKFKTSQEAFDYLATTQWKHTIEAKQFINTKFSNNGKGNTKKK